MLITPIVILTNPSPKTSPMFFLSFIHYIMMALCLCAVTIKAVPLPQESVTTGLTTTELYVRVVLCSLSFEIIVAHRKSQALVRN
ncbi:hypothetical protein J3R30DRAFT_3588570 [Lentinula aciculospora]|uniref:Uncharacterized protein n=1 Tax=Lentinula aciculospora TaxID=153920 RepID=A0A9W9DEA4_9AGAR|nr:hypothetical protein J3R30DRAFT_3588570 [Lentinula aciculospora]